MRTVIVKDWRQIAAADGECFPADEPPKFDDGTVWIALVEQGKLCAYAGIKALGSDVWYLNRAGVKRQYRGKGLQCRLIKARLKLAKRMGAKLAITYTILGNADSSNNLIRCGFKIYEPQYAWAGKTQSIYWRKEL
jgi:predicted GNAT family acetyltransferase